MASKSSPKDAVEKKSFPDSGQSAGNKPIPIDPLTSKETLQGKLEAVTRIEDDPEYPIEWRAKAVGDCVVKGWKYYRRRIKDKVYMILRKGQHDRSLGLYTEELEKKLFEFHPDVTVASNIDKPLIQSYKAPAGRTYLSVPIARVGVIPRDYVPSLNVLRYFQFIKEEGFPGDFSKFINDIIFQHFRYCHGVILPVLIEENIEVIENSSTSE